MADIFGDQKLDEDVYDDMEDDGTHGDDPNSDEEGDPLIDNQASPPVTRQEERVINNELSFGPDGKPMYRDQSQQKQLLMVFGAHGEPLVYYAENGRQLEQPRPPTAAEFQLVKDNGYFLKGGPVGAAPGPSDGLPWGWMLAGGLALAAGGYWYWQTKREEDAIVEEIDDDEDDDDED